MCDIFSSIGLIYLNIYLGLTFCYDDWVWINKTNFYIFLGCFIISAFFTRKFGHASVADFKHVGPYEVGFKRIFTKGTKQRVTVWYPVDRPVYERQYDPSNPVPIKDFKDEIWCYSSGVM
jgi:hypothetical protein